MTNWIDEKLAEIFPHDGVAKLPLTGPDNAATPHFGLFLKKGDTLGASVGKAFASDYEPHQREDVAVLVRAAAAAFEDKSPILRGHFNGGASNGGHVVTLQPSRGYRETVYGTNDAIYPKLIIRATYDGRAYRTSFGLYRDACRNMQLMTVAGDYVSISIRHSAKMRGRIAEVENDYHALAARWSGIVETCRTMAEKKVDGAEFLRAVYPERPDATDRMKKADERRIVKIFNRLTRERRALGMGDVPDDRQVSAWEMFQAVQGYVQWDQSRRGKPSEIERALIALEDKAVSRALEVATAA